MRNLITCNSFAVQCSLSFYEKKKDCLENAGRSCLNTKEGIPGPSWEISFRRKYTFVIDETYEAFPEGALHDEASDVPNWLVHER